MRKRFVPRTQMASTWAQGARGVSPAEWRLLVTMSSYVNQEREDFAVWPAHSLLAEETETSVATVKRLIASLVEKGFIRVEQQQRENGATSSNRYYLLVRTLQEHPDDSDAAEGHGAQLNMTGGVAHIELGAQVTGEPCSELLNIEPLELEDSPLPPAGGDAGKVDLFGFPIVESRQEIEEFTAAMFIERWQALASEFPRVAGCRLLSDRRRSHLFARIADHAGRKDFTIADADAVIVQMVDKIRNSPFLCGEVKEWAVSPSWALGPENFDKIMDRRNERELPSIGGTGNAIESGRRALELLRGGA